MCAHHLSRLREPRHDDQRREIFLRSAAQACRTGLVLLVLLSSRCAAATSLRRMTACICASRASPMPANCTMNRDAIVRLAGRVVRAGAARPR